MWSRIKAHLVEDWHQAWKFISVQLAAVLLLLEQAYDYLPAVQQYLPAHWVSYLAAAIILGRVIQQTKKKE